MPLLAAGLVALTGDPYAFGLRARVALALALAALAGAALLARRLRDRATVRRELALVAAVSLPLAIAAPMASEALRSPPELALAAAAAAAVCAAYLLLAWHAERFPGPSASSPVPRWQPLAAASAAFAGMAIALLVSRDARPLIVDEVVYLFQAATLGEPHFGRRVDEDLLGFFALPLSFHADGRLHGQYPAGWPALLRIFATAGLEDLSAPLLGAAAVALTFAIGRRIMSPRSAVLAAALLAANGMFLDVGGSYFAHIPTAAFVLLGALSLLRAEEGAGGARDVAFAVAGLALGVSAAIRPITGVALGASVVLWSLLRGRLGARAAPRMLAVMALGAAAPMAATLYYNAATTGDALLFGYSKAHGSLVSPGFGLRGQIVYDSTGAARPHASAFTPAVATRNLVVVGTRFVGAILPGLSAVIVLVVSRRTLTRRRTLLVAASFLALPLAHYFIFYPDVRYYTELLPFVALGTAWLVEGLAARRRAMAWALAAFALVASAVAAAGRLRAARASNRALLASVRAIEDAHRDAGPILVFVSDPVPGESMLARLWAFNVGSFDGGIVVARDLGARNDVLRRALADRAAYRLRRTGATDARLERLD